MCALRGESQKIFHHRGHRGTQGNPHCDLSKLASESADYVEHECENYAEQNRSSEWEIERRVLAAIENIARQAANGQVGAAEQDEGKAGDHQNNAKNDEDFPEVAHIKSLSR